MKRTASALIILASSLSMSFVVSALADDSCPPSPATVVAPELSQLAVALSSGDLPAWQKEFASHIKKLTRGIDTFSWTLQATVDKYTPSVVGTDAKGKAFLQSNVDNYKAMLKSDSNNEGPGLYLASDPSSTAYYDGDDHWVLLKVPFKAGQSFVDVRDNENKPFSAAAKAELTKLGCDADNVDQMTTKKSCHALFVDAAQKFDVSFLSYSYGVDQLKGFPERSTTCFVLTSMSGVDWKGFRILDSTVPASDPAASDRSLITGAFQLAIQDPRNDPKEAAALAASLPWKSVKPTSSTVLNTYVKEHYFNASDYPEDKDPNTARDFLERFSKLQSQASAIKTKDGTSIDPLRFKFLVQDYSPNGASNAPGASLLKQYPPIPLAEVDARWKEDQTARALADASAKAGDPLTLETLQKWIPGVKKNLADSTMLENSLSTLEPVLKAPHTLERVMDLFNSTLDSLNFSYPFDHGMGTMGQAFIEYMKVRAGFPPLFVSQPTFRTQDRRYLTDTSQAYSKMQDCLERWKTEDPGKLQASECGLVGP
jgi:hypothetical protein